MKHIKYYWQFAPSVWKILIVGWLVVFFSYYFNFDFPSSGAVLSCCVIIAEIIFTQWALYDNFEESTKSGATLSLPRYFRRRIRELAKNDEEAWASAKRIHKNIQVILVVNLVIGTLIWGYGHHLVKVSECLCT